MKRVPVQLAYPVVPHSPLPIPIGVRNTAVSLSGQQCTRRGRAAIPLPKAPYINDI